MRVAILSAGPSLRRTWTKHAPFYRYTATLAVNRALLLYPCDYLVAGDACTLTQLSDAHHWPALATWTMRDVVDHPPQHWHQERLLPFDHLPGWCDLKPAPNWSIQAAVAVAHALGATSADVFGHDMAGVHDATGHPGEQRTPERWERERSAWDTTLHWAAHHGLTVTTKTT